MAVKKVSITRSQWLFSAQGIPGAARVDAITGIAAERCKLMNIPPCVAIAISPRSQVRAITVGAPGSAWPGSMIDLIEGAPQIFSWPGGLVDLVKYDWTDGFLEIECAETPEDIASLSVYIATEATLTVVGLASPLLVHLQGPRLAGAGAISARGAVQRAGGASSTLQATYLELSADGRSLIATITGATSIATATGASYSNLAGLVGFSTAYVAAHGVIQFTAVDPGAVFNGRFTIRGA